MNEYRPSLASGDTCGNQYQSVSAPVALIVVPSNVPRSGKSAAGDSTATACRNIVSTKAALQAQIAAGCTKISLNRLAPSPNRKNGDR